MARRFFAPSQDATLYQQYPTRNSGKDEVLEVGKNDTGAKQIRSLLKFDLTTISASLADGTFPANTDFYLNLRVAGTFGLQTGQLVNVYMASQSWVEGTGYFAQDIENPSDGATWQKATNAGAIDYSESYNGGVTQSYTASSDVWGANGFAAVTGGAFFSASGVGKPSASFSFGAQINDVRLDVSSFIRDWQSGSTTNDGFLFKYPSADETNSLVKSVARFFALNTHTIFPPTIEAVWNNQTVHTTIGGTAVLQPAPSEIEIFVKNFPAEMATGSVHRLRIGARDLYPIKSFTDVNRYGTKYFLPSGSHIGVKDASSGEFIIPFDTGSFISADTTSSYYDLRIENLYINRTYQLYVKVNKSWGTEVYDTGHRFRVIKGY